VSLRLTITLLENRVGLGLRDEADMLWAATLRGRSRRWPPVSVRSNSTWPRAASSIYAALASCSP
jgi:hypothetical protein